MGQGFISKYILRGIADFIRGRKNTTAEIKPVDMVAELESIPTYEQGIEQGKQAEYDRFWDEYQEKGNRSYYERAFSSLRWNDITYKPKYHIKPLASYNFLFSESRVVDTKVDIDFSRITKKTTVSRIFAYDSALTTIRKLIVNENIVFDTWFASCGELINLMIEGVIAQNGFNLQWSTKLSKASIESIIGHLSTTTSGLGITLSQTAVNNAFTTEEWTALEQTRPNWTISLV